MGFRFPILQVLVFMFIFLGGKSVLHLYKWQTVGFGAYVRKRKKLIGFPWTSIHVWKVIYAPWSQSYKKCKIKQPSRIGRMKGVVESIKNFQCDLSEQTDTIMHMGSRMSLSPNKILELSPKNNTTWKPSPLSYALFLGEASIFCLV